MSLKRGHTETDGSYLKSGENVPSSVPVVIDKESAAPLEILVRRSTDYACPPGVDSYRMKSRPRGNVLLINNIEFAAKCHNARVGSQVDSANLESLFRQLGFDVTAEQNLPLAQMRKAIIKHSELESHENADMSVVCILSHGEENDKLSSADCEKISTEWVVGKYRSDDCPYLHRKPKLFIIQACRGKEEDSGVKELLGRKVSTDASGTVPNGEDILIVNATVPRFVAHRDTLRGSWFIECFCEVVMERAFNTDLRDMLDEVAERLRGPKYQDEEGNKQIFEYANRHFRKKLFFNPGLYEDTALQNQPLAKEVKPSVVQANPSGVQVSVRRQFAGAVTAVDGGASDVAVDGGTSDVAVDGGASDGAVDGGASDGAVDGGASDVAVDGGTEKILDPNSQEAETEISLERSNDHESRKSICLNESAYGGNYEKEDARVDKSLSPNTDISLDVLRYASSSDDLNRNENLEIDTYMDATDIGKNDHKEVIENDIPLDGVPENEIASDRTWYIGLGAAIIVLAAGICLRKFHYHK